MSAKLRLCQATSHAGIPNHATRMSAALANRGVCGCDGRCCCRTTTPADSAAAKLCDARCDAARKSGIAVEAGGDRHGIMVIGMRGTSEARAAPASAEPPLQ